MKRQVVGILVVALVVLVSRAASAQYLTPGMFWDVYAQGLKIGTAVDLEPQEPLSGALAIRVQDDHVKLRIGDFGSFGQNWIMFDRARGTYLAPEALRQWDILGTIQSVGHDGESFYNGGAITFRATQDWVDGGHGNYVNICSTANDTEYCSDTFRAEGGRARFPNIGYTPPVPGGLRYACIDNDNTLVASATPCVP